MTWKAILGALGAAVAYTLGALPDSAPIGLQVGLGAGLAFLTGLGVYQASSSNIRPPAS